MLDQFANAVAAGRARQEAEQRRAHDMRASRVSRMLAHDELLSELRNKTLSRYMRFHAPGNEISNKR